MKKTKIEKLRTTRVNKKYPTLPMMVIIGLERGYGMVAGETDANTVRGEDRTINGVAMDPPPDATLALLKKTAPTPRRTQKKQNKKKTTLHTSSPRQHDTGQPRNSA